METPPHETPLVFERVGFRRGEQVVIHDVSLSVSAGETVAILGPSGAGKSTLLRLALGLLPIETGHIWIAGQDIARLTEREFAEARRHIGVVFQNGALFTAMDVADNVAFGIAESGYSDAEVATRVRVVLESVGLQGFGSRMPDELSGGQAQRVAVARALIMEPTVMLYDEPTQGLDPQRALDVVREILRLSREGVASVAVTHQLEYARLYAHRVALLEDGHITYDGPIDGLHQLDDPFVRSFFEVLEGDHDGHGSVPTLH